MTQGKIDREAFPPLRPGTIYVAPRTPIENRLVRYWQSTLGVERIGIRDDVFELGATSLLAARLSDIIEAEFSKRVPITTLYSAGTVEAQAKLIPTPDTYTVPSPIIKIRDHGGRIPLFFLHAAYNGGGFYCLRLARHLGDDQPFYSLLPILAQNRALPESIKDMARTYIKMLRTVQPNGPYWLAGFCSAGLIALEMAQQLQAGGERVDFLGIIDISARNADLRIHRSLVKWAARILRLNSRQELDAFLRLRNMLCAYKTFSGIDRIRLVFEKIGKVLKALPNVAWKRSAPDSRHNSEMMSCPADPVDADTPGWEDLRPHYRRLWSGYIVRPYSGHITLLRTNDHKALENNPSLGWDRIAADLEVCVTPGDHLGCLTDKDNLARLGEHLKACLDRRQIAICTGD